MTAGLPLSVRIAVVRAAPDRQNSTAARPDKRPACNEGDAMTAVVRIVTGPARTGKTGRLLQRCRALSGPNRDGLLWLCPNRRRLDQLCVSLADVPGLRLTTFADLADELIATSPDVEPLPRGQGRLLLDECVSELL